MDLIAERAGMAMPGGEREFLSAMALDSLRAAMTLEERRLADGGEAFGDESRAALAEVFAKHSPIGFLLSLPEIIGTNAMKFDDEEVLESCILRCLETIFSEGNKAGG